MENITKVSDFDSVKLTLASPADILEWSKGEITKPETINYRTQRYEPDGLFCEKIFGPSKDWECYCGKYKRIRYQGIVCDKCGVEVTRAIVRRERMGHIKLATPVSHIWFLRGVPSKIGLALGISPQDLERVIYFSSYIIMEVKEALKEQTLEALEKEYKAKTKEIRAAEKDETKLEKALEDLKEQYRTTKDDIKNLRPNQILSEVEYFNLSSRFGQVFTAGIGAEAIRKILEKMDIPDMVDILKKELSEDESVDQKKLLQRLKVYQGFQKANLRLEWMLPTAIPVIPPDLRPMVALDGGRFATSDLNDLYRRIINRNNRLKKLLAIGAPEVITRNEKRMLQEAVDALFDNSARRGQASTAASTGQRRPLRSLADALKGKQGRFRQNLLGKRVDYSGRSVIVVGPKLKLYQCGLPKKMALELFKPFIINKLIEKEHAHNVRTAGRMVDAESEEAYEILDEIIPQHYVLLNRAPTLHRLSIQAFQPVLIEGKAIRLHPMVCSAFNADFDGDQMAVHVPLTAEARGECATIMLSSKNLLKPASGEPIVSATLDMVLGAYYLTHTKVSAKGEGKAFGTMDEAILAYDTGAIAINALVRLSWEGAIIETSVGRILLNDILPPELRFVNEEMTKKDLKVLISRILETLGQDEAALFADRLKDLAFKSVSKSGFSWGMDDLKVPKEKNELIRLAEEKVKLVKDQFNMGLLTNEERKGRVIEVWNETKNQITDAVRATLDKEGPVYAMVYSKARGSESVVVQMTGMKGLMAGPTGETIELPVKSNFKDGFNVLEYFISTHGARKGMADTALRTATAGYLTRRLVDVSQDIIVRENDCNDTTGAYLYREDSDKIGMSYASRIEGRYAAETIKDPTSGDIIAKKNELISRTKGKEIETNKAIPKVKVRSLVTCKSRRGVCQKCYGIDLGRNALVELGASVGVVAAQAIGEPGTQLTMRTFHVGGVAGSDITQGLPRVEEIFEARTPKTEAILSEVDGQVTSIEKEVKVVKVTVLDEVKVEHEYSAPANAAVKVKVGDLVGKGSILSEGHVDLKKLHEVMGEEAGNVIVEASVPGISEDKLEITYEEGVLHIKGRSEEKEEEKNKNRIVHKMQRVSSFEYSTYLPRPVDDMHMEASVKNGVLIVKAPIAEAARAKRIPIKTNAK
jgi:DNA-directed RNA polymerase subunit beta'